MGTPTEKPIPQPTNITSDFPHVRSRRNEARLADWVVLSHVGTRTQFRHSRTSVKTYKHPAESGQYSWAIITCLFIKVCHAIISARLKRLQGRPCNQQSPTFLASQTTIPQQHGHSHIGLQLKPYRLIEYANIPSLQRISGSTICCLCSLSGSLTNMVYARAYGTHVRLNDNVSPYCFSQIHRATEESFVPKSGRTNPLSSNTCPQTQDEVIQPKTLRVPIQ